MISGFNTDIEHNGTVYHVQTEDKGLSKRMIMSLVYNKGTILASKRVSYDDLAAANFDEKELSERLNRQHKLICAAVRTGRIEELKGMAAKSAPVSAARKTISVAPAVTETRPVPIVQKPPIRIELLDVEKPQLPPVAIPSRQAEPIIDAVIVEDVEIMPAEAVAVVSEFSGRERTANNKLSLELLGETKFKGGDRPTVNLLICRGTDRRVVPDAQIMIKVLGSAFRPVIFHAKTDGNGLARVHLQLPIFTAGRAALLVRVISDGEEIELRRAVTPA